MALPQSGAHPNAVDMSGLSQLWREILSNARDWVIDQNLNRIHTLDVTAGGIFTLTIDQQFAGYLIRLTGTPGAPFTVKMLDGNTTMVFDNVSGQTATIDTVSGAASPPTVANDFTLIVQERGTELTTTGVVGLDPGALLHSGSVSPTGSIDFADFTISRVELKDVSLTVTSPSSSGGTLVLDIENGNIFDVTLTEAVTTLTISNPPVATRVGAIVIISRQDGTGGWEITWPASVKWAQDLSSKILLEDSFGSSLLLETGDQLLLEPSLDDGQTLDPDATDIYILKTFDAGTTWYAAAAGLDIR